HRKGQPKMSESMATTVTWGASTAAGLLFGAAAQTGKLTRGDVAVIHSGAIWGGVLGFAARSFTLRYDPRVQPEEMEMYGALIGTTIGVGTAALFDITRRQMFFADVGGAIGFGASYATLLASNAEPTITAGAITSGAVIGGMAIAAVLTHFFDKPYRFRTQ